VNAASKIAAAARGRRVRRRLPKRAKARVQKIVDQETAQTELVRAQEAMKAAEAKVTQAWRKVEDLQQQQEYLKNRTVELSEEEKEAVLSKLRATNSGGDDRVRVAEGGSSAL
jgi:hypothetical protein